MGYGTVQLFYAGNGTPTYQCFGDGVFIDCNPHHKVHQVVEAQEVSIQSPGGQKSIFTELKILSSQKRGGSRGVPFVLTSHTIADIF